MVLTPRRLIRRLWLASLLAGCASQQATRVPGDVAPSARTIVAQLEKQTHEQDIFVANNSSRDVRITGITLSACFNVRMACSHYPLDVLIASGQRRLILTVTANEPDAGYYYHYDYTWAVLRSPAR